MSEFTTDLAEGDRGETSPLSASVVPRPAHDTDVRDWIALLKPRVMSLLLLTTVAAMFAGAAGMPSPGALLATIAGGMMAAGGASAVNHVLDRDIDQLMGPRTKHRPVAEGRISPVRALCFGCGLGVAAFLLLLVVPMMLGQSSIRALQWLAALLPGGAGNGFLSGSTDPMSPTLSLVVLVVWAVAGLAVGLRVLQRRDA